MDLVVIFVLTIILWGHSTLTLCGEVLPQNKERTLFLIVEHSTSSSH